MICRLCLHQGTDDFISVLNNDHIVEKIRECVSIEIADNDDLPTTACTSCIQKVEDWWIFKDSCLKTNNVLLELCREKVRRRDEPESEVKEVIIVKEELREPDSSYICEICSKRFNTCLEHLEHQSTHNGSPVYKCDKCEEVFSSRDDLVEHDRNHKLPCPKCGKLILKTSLKLHLVLHTDKHMCSQCSSRFTSNSTLQQHIITLHTSQRDHVCETCGKRFASKTAMTVHSRSHSDERLYKCKSCDYAGRTASALYVHMSTHSQETCVCEVCSKIFKSNRNLNDHLRRTHRKEKNHQCTRCDKKFVDRYRLTVHMRCHTGVKPYVCRLCDKAFIRSDGLKDHMATHGDRVWYPCEKCGRKFASKKGVTRHNCTGEIA
ncbi:zinc finger protein 675-like isoform X1 [Zophobas morio]|uniref:zinc finger protein 675-like isoform X1 n=1 Tax=Zophobas morio TaxID=2755281 RepID=UPI003082AAE3